jgi:ABC-type antimicrobial peptide transport system permease subunit
MASLDRELALFDVLTMTERVDRSLVNRRSPVVLSLTFGAIALLLSAIGIYGVLAYVVTQRTREIGIRLALGSSGRRIFDLILREGLVLVAAGFALGAAGGLALRRSLQSQLFQISATDPLVLAGAAVVLALVAVAACALPARRATRIDPLIALAQ